MSAPQVINWDIPVVKRFRAQFDHCGAEDDYAYEDIFVFPGPPPAPEFDIHPVFKYLNF